MFLTLQTGCFWMASHSSGVGVEVCWPLEARQPEPGMGIIPFAFIVSYPRIIVFSSPARSTINGHIWMPPSLSGSGKVTVTLPWWQTGLLFAATNFWLEEVLSLDHPGKCRSRTDLGMRSTPDPVSTKQRKGVEFP